MTRFLSAALAGLSLAAVPALAQTMTIEFAEADGTTAVWVFMEDGIAIGPDGMMATYTYDEAARTLCGEIEGGDPPRMCATFAEANEEPAVGDTSAYTTDAGTAGTATIIAIEE